MDKKDIKSTGIVVPEGYDEEVGGIQYKPGITEEDFKKLVRDIQEQNKDMYKRNAESWRMMDEVAEQPDGVYVLPNGMAVSAEFARNFREAMDEYFKNRTK
jgi:hypothetical protein